MSTPLVVYGAGGHGKVVCDILLAAGERVDGFIDGAKLGSEVMGLPIVGGADWLVGKNARVALGVGDNAARERIALECARVGASLVTAVHPTAVIARSAAIDDGTVVMALAVVNAEARIGRGAIINTAAVIEHDCVVGSFAHVSPNAAMAGGCTLGARAHLGIGASMLPRTAVGDDTVIGGGALVSRDIAKGVVATGVPARPRH